MVSFKRPMLFTVTKSLLGHSIWRRAFTILLGHTTFNHALEPQFHIHSLWNYTAYGLYYQIACRSTGQVYVAEELYYPPVKVYRLTADSLGIWSCSILLWDSCWNFLPQMFCWDSKQTQQNNNDQRTFGKRPCRGYRRFSIFLVVLKNLYLVT